VYNDCCSIVFGVTLRLLVINISSSSRAINKLRLLVINISCRLAPSTNSAAYCHQLVSQLATVRRHRVDNAWRSHPLQQGLEPELVGNRKFCLPHLHGTPPLWGFPSEYCHDVWYQKTKMVWLTDGGKILQICLFFSTESTNVTDRQTYGHRMTA